MNVKFQIIKVLSYSILFLAVKIISSLTLCGRFVQSVCLFWKLCVTTQNIDPDFTVTVIHSLYISCRPHVNYLPSEQQIERSFKAIKVFYK